MASYDSKSSNMRAGGSETVLSRDADINNMRMAYNARNVIQDMHTDAYRLLSNADDVSNAREAIEDVAWYINTGRAPLSFEGAIGAMTKEQQKQFVEGLAEDTRSRDGNVAKAKQLIKKIKPNAGEAEIPSARALTDEQKRISEAVARDYQADRTAESMARKYGSSKPKKSQSQSKKSGSETAMRDKYKSEITQVTGSKLDSMSMAQLRKLARKASVFQIGAYPGAPKTEESALARFDALVAGQSKTSLKRLIMSSKKKAK